MTHFDDTLAVDGVQIVRLESDHLRVGVAPGESIDTSVSIYAGPVEA